MQSRIAPAIRPALTVKVFNEFGLGKVVTVKVSNALSLSVWLGDETSGKQRYGDRATEAAHSTNANAVMTASFHWWMGKGFILLGHLVCNGESQNSPNQDLLLLRRCYFATTWDGKFLIGEANLTTGKLLRGMPKVRHLFGGG
ncbi:MAG: hypothetical protein N3B10_14355 [Armatimonadetes bacterium]|nr:hypothetical protein [Armatimonadota bacterium]